MTRHGARADESGIALVLCLLAMLLLTAVGAALVTTSSVDARIAGTFSAMVENGDASVVALERALADLPADASWDSLLAGSQLSGFVDGAPGGARTLADGSTLNLTYVVNLANCGRTAGCTAAQMSAVTSERPWGANNPQWRLFAFGPLSRLLPPGEIESNQYLVVLLADDPGETDDDPLTDAGAGSAGSGVVTLRAESFGSGGAHSAVVVTVMRADGLAPARFMSWHSLARLDRP